MADYTSTKYDNQRIWIDNARSRGLDWEAIRYGNSKERTDDGLSHFLELQNELNYWEVTIDDWKAIVELAKEAEEKRENLDFSQSGAIITEGEDSNDLNIPQRPDSCWQKYKHYLLKEQGFSYYDVQSIEISSHKILKQLNSDTKGEAIKGLVVGNVQSGKTANMAAVMAMAADNGWNMFVVLSGTIENLRVQTLNRLINDLNRPGCNITWRGISHPAASCSIEDKIQSLNISLSSTNKYLTVALKNHKRLEDLIDWLHADPNSMGNMKVLVIDDESDQASVNTKDIEQSDERTRINDLIVNLVGEKKSDGTADRDSFKAMNYIGYTATPYANVLNEAKPESLYPKNFISTLEASKAYFGPQQIFGDRHSGVYPGLKIVRTIPSCDLEAMKEIHDGENIIAPDSLEDAIAWFLCCVAMLRKYKHTKPISMLIHTSQRVAHHSNVHIAVKNWFAHSSEFIIEKCRTIWERETNLFTKEDLFNDYPDYAFSKEDIREYLAFEDIEDNITDLLSEGVTNIMLGDKGELKYNRGVHLCVDNAKNNKLTDDGEYLRLAYPDKTVKLGFAPAFIVIGGATLSRGLTIEGLLSTFFLRSSRQADTLMQMGRWFGYRHGFELLQRVWLTENGITQFEFLSDMDSELREEIAEMEQLGKSPSKYAVAVRQSPAVNMLRLSAKNKMQSAVSAELNFSGLRAQTHLLVEDEDALKDNYNSVISFVKHLETTDRGEGKHGEKSLVWRNVPFETICDELLDKFIFHEKLKTFDNLEAVKSWVKEMQDKGRLTDWNVVLFGSGSGGDGETIGDYTIRKVKRTRRVAKGERPNTINIQILTDPKEKVADVQYSKLDPASRDYYDEYKSRYEKMIRKSAGLEKTPSLVLYVIDKDSKYEGTSKVRRRYDLDVDTDVAGISLNIPGEKINEDYASSVAIDLRKFGLGVDIENGVEEDEN